MRPISVSLPFTREAHFIPAGCIHFPIGERDLLREWVQALRTQPNAFSILMGDSLDAVRTHYRNHLRSYRADQNSQLELDRYHRADVLKLAKILRPVRHKILGAILGNHYWEFSDGTNTEQLLCRELEIPYLGPVGIVRVDFRDRRHFAKASLTIYAHHHGGTRGARTTGGDVSALERSELLFEADIYAMGHTHRKFGFKIPKMGTNGATPPAVVERTKVILRTGAFLKGFAPDYPSANRPHFPTYAEVDAYRPTDLGFVDVRIRFWRKNARETTLRRDYQIAA